MNIVDITETTVLLKIAPILAAFVTLLVFAKPNVESNVTNIQPGTFELTEPNPVNPFNAGEVW